MIYSISADVVVMMNIDDVVRFKNKADGRVFTIRSVNDKKLIMGDYYQVAVISFSAWGIEWRSEVSKSEIEVVKDV